LFTKSVELRHCSDVPGAKTIASGKLIQRNNSYGSQTRPQESHRKARYESPGQESPGQESPGCEGARRKGACQEKEVTRIFALSPAGVVSP
jgi:hypothetical protein